jgi:GT2 family glycosyltransferase
LNPTASIVIPTRERPDYLEVALASIAPQAAAAGIELLVVHDDRPSPAIRAIAERFDAAYISHDRPLGLNAARNTGIAHTHGELIVFVDDDVEVRPGWLKALLHAAHEHPHTQVFTGPIRPRLEGHPPRSCGREGSPITALDLGPEDTNRVQYAWGANMTVRRGALERVGPFDAELGLYGDEQEWQDRLLAASHPKGEDRNGGAPDGANAEQVPSSEGDPHGETPKDGPILYVAAAALDHRRSPADARLRSLARAARARGRASRRYNGWRGAAGGRVPSLTSELRTLAGCLGHVVRRRCPAGLAMVAHSLGRLEQGLSERRHPPAPRETEDFLSGESGTVGGLDAVRREAKDRLIDARKLLSGRRIRLDRAARRSPPRRRVLVLGVERPERHALAVAIRAELLRSRHDVELHTRPPGGLGKFQNLNLLLAVAGNDDPDATRDLQASAGQSSDLDRGRLDQGRAREAVESYDWLVVVDDDVVLPHGFLDRLLFLAERFDFQLVQPAHRARSHAAWRVTRRRAGSVARQTPFVEIGPVTAFARATCPSPMCAWAGALTCTGPCSPASTGGAAGCSTPSRSATPSPPPETPTRVRTPSPRRARCSPSGPT